MKQHGEDEADDVGHSFSTALPIRASRANARERQQHEDDISHDWQCCYAADVRRGVVFTTIDTLRLAPLARRMLLAVTVSTRGSLRIYLGAAPGVGKTFDMLDEAHRRADRGTDVVVGFVETHGRARTAERVAGLEVVPRKNGDLPRTHSSRRWISTRSCGAVRSSSLVDELAHTNVPGSGVHEKRWQDVETLLEAGIDVLSTVNVQHLESLNDVVETHHRRAAARDRPGRRGARCRAGATGRHDARGAAPADGARQHLPAGEDRRGAGQLLPAGQPDRAARARPALVGRPGRGGDAALPRAARHHRTVGDARTGRRRAHRRPGGRRADPPRGTDRGAQRRRRPDRGARVAQRRRRRRRVRPGWSRSGCSSNRSAAATTRSSPRTSRARSSTSPAASTPPRSCWAPRGAGRGRRRSPVRAPARPSPGCPGRSTCTSSATTTPAAGCACPGSATA